MAIPPEFRDDLLSHAQHRCTVCCARSEDIYNIIDHADGGKGEPENLIVLCSECNRKRLDHQDGFDPVKLRLYKAGLSKISELERRLNLNKAEIQARSSELTLKEFRAQWVSALDDMIKASSILYTDDMVLEIVRGAREISKNWDQPHYKEVVQRLMEYLFCKTENMPFVPYVAWSWFIGTHPSGKWMSIIGEGDESGQGKKLQDIIYDETKRIADLWKEKQPQFEARKKSGKPIEWEEVKLGQEIESRFIRHQNLLSTIWMLQNRHEAWKKFRLELETRYEIDMSTFESIKADWDEILVLPFFFSSYLQKSQLYSRLLNVDPLEVIRKTSNAQSLEDLKIDWKSNLHINAMTAAKALCNEILKFDLKPKRSLSRIYDESGRVIEKIQTNPEAWHLFYAQEMERLARTRQWAVIALVKYMIHHELTVGEWMDFYRVKVESKFRKDRLPFEPIIMQNIFDLYKQLIPPFEKGRQRLLQQQFKLRSPEQKGLAWNAEETKAWMLILRFMNIASDFQIYKENEEGLIALQVRFGRWLDKKPPKTNTLTNC